MSYNIETTELYVCTYDYSSINIPNSYIIMSKKEIQSEILDRWGKAMILPSKIEKLNIIKGKKVSYKEFVPKRYRTKEVINPENPSSVDDDTVETLEDLIATVINKAVDDALQQREAKTLKITNGIKIPGLF